MAACAVPWPAGGPGGVRRRARGFPWFSSLRALRQLFGAGALTTNRRPRAARRPPPTRVGLPRTPAQEPGEPWHPGGLSPFPYRRIPCHCALPCCSTTFCAKSSRLGGRRNRIKARRIPQATPRQAGWDKRQAAGVGSRRLAALAQLAGRCRRVAGSAGWPLLLLPGVDPQLVERPVTSVSSGGSATPGRHPKPPVAGEGCRHPDAASGFAAGGGPVADDGGRSVAPDSRATRPATAAFPPAGPAERRLGRRCISAPRRDGHGDCPCGPVLMGIRKTGVEGGRAKGGPCFVPARGRGGGPAGLSAPQRRNRHNGRQKTVCRQSGA